MLRDRCFESCNILNSDELLDWLTILEYDDRRDTHDTELSWDLRIIVHVVLHDLRFPFSFAREFLEAREHELAWTTPLCPEVDKSDARGDISSKSSISRDLERHNISNKE